MNLQKFSKSLFIGLMIAFATTAFAADKGCISCHKGIEDIRHSDSDMMKQIKGMGAAIGDPQGCVICHGGNVKASTKEEAHKAAPNHPGGLEAFVRDPGSTLIVDKTCGLCHSDHVYNLERALMQTEAGKIQGNMHSWGTWPTKKVRYGNYAVKDTDGQTPRFGTDTYKKYMEKMAKANPDQFPVELEALPLAVQSAEELEGLDEKELGKQASLTYQRSDCQRCHVGVRGRKGRGDWRGMGCSACHIPYGNEGKYEGGDPTIDKKEAGHLLVHQMQGTRDAKVEVNGASFTGMHPETCNSCHNRGKRIGVSYIGFMEQPYSSPLDDTAKDLNQRKSHGKRYKHIKADLHFEAGMTCQDCHTSIDMHGDGNIFGTTLAQVEVECSDCHGTTKKYPWELPIGYGEEFEKKIDQTARGLAKELPYFMTEGMVYNKQDGYVLSTRGNPLGNVVKVKGKNEAIAHLASGKDLKIPLIKNKNIHDEWKSLNSQVAMGVVEKHMDSMECYACHSDWAPQCYGCHIKVDYRKGKSKIDWVASQASKLENSNGETLESVLGTKGVKLYGHAKETRSYLRWEDPILGINGEGRVTPLMPGCQVTFTVVGPNGKVMILNKQAQVPDGPNGSLVAGTDMSPVQPHTSGRKARSCESCHANPKAMGYGIQDGQFMTKQGKDLIMDITDLKTGKIIPKNKTVQMRAIPGMDWDWSQIVTRDGKQLQSVGTHWPLSRPLDQDTRENMERTGVCMSCHQHMTTPALWNKLSKGMNMDSKTHIKRVSELLKKSAE